MIQLSIVSYALLSALAVLVAALAVDVYRRRRMQAKQALIGHEELPAAPGPRSWPLIGSLHLLGGYEVPYAAFTDLAKKYGPIISMNLGSQKCLVVNGLNNIKDVLVTKGAHFDGRPNFARFHQLFCGDKENSLAFCDWSDLQKVRREMLRAHTFPPTFSSRFSQLDIFVADEMRDLTSRLDATNGDFTPIKPELMHACANIFTAYFCSKRFDRHDAAFNRTIDNFDSIFYEVNQGCAADFLPWLLPFHSKQMAQMKNWSHEIREFMENFIINDRLARRRQGLVAQDESTDYVEALLEHVEDQQTEKLLTFDSALFALEDIVGGHSAVANLLVKALGFVASRPEVQERVKIEADLATGNGARPLTLQDRVTMPYTDAVILEAIRMISSPIVPHVSNQDSSIAGYKVEKDTLIFLNNHELNMSDKLWEEPLKFKPERFLSTGRLMKPEHFLPFGVGRRSCMGYKMVQFLAFAIVGTLLQRYSLEPEQEYKVPVGDLALPKDTFKFKFIAH
ncbi:cytochrome P450 307a1-like [Cloeon dipterum]|uniref:cytochrome P450 307a1-like n=1 Tax=Cloeon dipterum TaxID=197152 RepID=UPI00321F7788